MNKTKQKRRFIALMIIFLLLFLIFFLLFRKTNYTLEYKIDGFTVQEEYDKDSDYFTFILTKDDKSYTTVLQNQHSRTKKLIYQINEYRIEEESCIEVFSNQLRFYPLCLKNEEQISYHLTSEEMKENFDFKSINTIDETYKSFQIKNYFYKTYYIWNYQGFYRINDNIKEQIKLFSQDVYDPKLIYQVDNLLFIPDYDSNYYFNKAYILDMSTGKYDTWNLTETLYFDSVILGTYENEFYLVDKHEKKEWKINLKKKTMELIGTESKGGKTYQNGFIETTMSKLMNQNMFFTGTTIIDYQNENGLYKTYHNYQERIRQESPTQIVSKQEQTVFYLVDDTLYCFTEDYGEIQIMTYFEWNFNYNNVIFIY